jgi:carboxymethylenebutenolidase
MEKTVDISTPDGFCDSYIAIPNGNGRYPALILYMDIWGLREELFEIAREISSLGYICIVPNFYYRQGKIRFDYRNNLNQVVSVNSLPEFYKEKIRILYKNSILILLLS